MSYWLLLFLTGIWMVLKQQRSDHRPEITLSRHVPFISVYKRTVLGFYENRVEAANIQTIAPQYGQLKV